MDERLLRLEAAVSDLQQRIDALEHRVARAESTSPRPAGTGDAFVPLAVPHFGAADGAIVIADIGRSLVALGGAYLLRAVTDANLVSHAAGVAAGLLYGLFWLGLADRAAQRSRLHAAFHGLVATIIGFPLLWEATVRFGVVTPSEAAAALAAMIAGLVAVSLRQRLQWLAWMAVVGAIGTSIALVGATGVLLPFAVVLVLFGVATQWIGYAFDWTLLRWPVAFAADLLVVGLTMRVAAKTGSESPFAAVTVQMLLLNGYVAGIVVRTLVRARNVNAFEVVQTIAALAVGFGGAVYLAGLTGTGVLPLAAINVTAGAACYAVAWVFVATRQGLNRNFYFYTSLAIVLLMVSTPLLFHAGPLAIVWTLLAVAATAVSRRSGRAALAWHGVLYLGAACAAAGVWADAADALVGSAAAAWQPYGAIAMTVTAAAIGCWAVAPPADRGLAGFGIPRALFAAIAIWAGGGWIVGLVAPALCGTPGAGANAGAIATVRTTILASAALGLAWMAHWPRLREAVWLLYLLLAAGAAKLLVEDLPTSKPATLFVALAFYGTALIVASRLGHRRASH